MITPIHLLFDYGIYEFLNKTGAVHTSGIDLILLFSENLIDLDHLFSRPIYKFKRNPFKTHPIHKKWKYVLVLAILLLFYRPTLFLGIGIMSHFFMDYLYLKIYKIK